MVTLYLVRLVPTFCRSLFIVHLSIVVFGQPGFLLKKNGDSLAKLTFGVRLCDVAIR